ncbi:MAG: hypothetical protein WBW33_34650 [Bryobacteraceae bacterium]
MKTIDLIDRLYQALARRPFWILTGHFASRMFSSDEPGEMSMGLGVVLGMLASPGAFASLFMLNKYSTLLQYFRGQMHFDPIRASAADEYFFVVLSMTITALIVVLRWNRLFPDRRDFANLAVLPLPIYHIFLANFVALLGLAVIFAVDVNCVSSVFFPTFVTMDQDTAAAFIHFAVPHVVTVLLASFFSFFAIFAVVGTLMLVLPRKLFRVLSLYLRILLVIGTLVTFFSNLFIQMLAGHVPGSAASYLPSVWFLGFFETWLGITRPGMAALGDRAVPALASAVVVSVLAYALSYRRHFLRLAEESDALPSSRRALRLSLPRWASRPVFPSEPEMGIASFALKTLFRSEQHLLFFGGYLGVGLVLVAEFALTSRPDSPLESVPQTDILAIPLLIAFFVLTGLRFVSDVPAALEANWLFQLSLDHRRVSPASIMRRLMLLLVIPWQILVCGPITAHFYGWIAALLHTVFVLTISLLIVNLLLVRFHKIPFTCSRVLDTRRLFIRLLACLSAVIMLVPTLAGLEQWALLRPSRFGILALLAAAVEFGIRRYQEGVPDQDRLLRFEDRPPPQFELLKLA